MRTFSLFCTGFLLMICSCAIFIYDNDDHEKSESDTLQITIIGAQSIVGPQR